MLGDGQVQYLQLSSFTGQAFGCVGLFVRFSDLI